MSGLYDDYSPLSAANVASAAIDSGKPLEKGQRVKLDFTSNPSKWIRATQIYVIESRLDKNKDITIISADYWGEDTISFDVEVTNIEALMTERKIIALILAASPLGFYLVHKPGIEKTVETVVEKIQTIASWTPSIAALIAVVVLLCVLKN